MHRQREREKGISGLSFQYTIALLTLGYFQTFVELPETRKN